MTHSLDPLPLPTEVAILYSYGATTDVSIKIWYSKVRPEFKRRCEFRGYCPTTEFYHGLKSLPVKTGLTRVLSSLNCVKLSWSYDGEPDWEAVKADAIKVHEHIKQYIREEE